MPKLNSRGDVICGVNGIQGSLNGYPYPVATYGRGCWLDDDTILVMRASPPLADGASDGAIYAWRPWADPNGAAVQLVDRRACNFLAGGGGQWVALIAAATPVQFGSLGDQVDAGVGDVALDGTICYKTQYHAISGVTIVRRDGSRVDRPEAYPLGYYALLNDQAIWPGGAEGRAPVDAYFPDAQYVKLAAMGGEDWLLYWSNQAGLILHPHGSTEGFIFKTTNAFDYDIIAIGADVVVAAATTQGEGPQDLTVVHANRGGVRYVVGSGPMPVWGPLKPPPPPIVYPTFSFSHKVMVAPFKDPDGATSAPVELVVNQTGQHKARPCFVAEDSLGAGWRGELLGIYSEATSPTDVIRTAENLKTRVLLVHDSKTPWSLAPGLRAWDIPGIELYRYGGETLADAVSRWRSDVDLMLSKWPGDCAVVPMYCCMGGAPPNELWPVGDVLETHAHLSEIVNRSSRIKVVAPFSYLRANGITAHIELQRSLTDLLAAAPQVPKLRPVDHNVPPPKPDPSRYLHHKGVPMVSLDGKTVRLRGIRGMLLRPDAPNTGIWRNEPGGWRGGIWDGFADGDTRCHYKAKAVGDCYSFTNIELDCLVGEDAGQYSLGVDQQVYHKPSGNKDAGDLELFRVYEGNKNGALSAQCEQTTDANHPSGPGKKLFTYPLCVEVVS